MELRELKKYRKKPVVVLAAQWRWSSGVAKGIVQPIDGDWHCKECGNHSYMHGKCPTLEGYHIVCPYDYIIQGVKGEYYPCKPDIFELTYEPVESSEN
ncbi:hypothetical protein B7C51_15765 [Paenibacillus larvae subsp. pulvifaciens]|uniref:Uncharacterized protein n=1 Tax=Paenibacillus larvae subsp. pulvifaciens TaxID=1477 RepID=A0A1V0UUU2_9BACL|nr:hypothetical protein B7C51_06855 [Paenibacillus larvae subsp. pulvifaciens]ARF68947.1 hypothetical protein B7C51_15765 [Paenibacillus larvae subsp. pulvifaciens]